MKKYLIAAITLILIISVTGCQKEDREVDASTITKRIMEEVSFKDSLSQISEDMVYRIYSISPDDVEYQEAYVGSGATAEEVAVIKAKDKNGADKIKKAFEQRVEEQKNSFRNYVPEELEKLEHAIVEQKGTTVILCVTDDLKKAEAIIK